MRGGVGGGLQKRLCGKQAETGRARCGMCWVLPLISLLYSHLSDQTGWFQAATSWGLMVVEVSLLPNHCSISLEQSWAEFGDGWMDDITATVRDAAAPRVAHGVHRSN